jgi:tricorn protease-like protein
MEKPVANPCWTPDGRIIFFSGWPSADLYVVNPDGSGLARLTKSAGLSEPAVSPDGTRVAAYVRGKDRIVSAPLNGDAAPVTLLGHARRYFPSGGVPIAAWTQDGKKLVLGGSMFGETRGSGLYIVNADGSGLKKIPHVTHAVCANWRPQ